MKPLRAASALVAVVLATAAAAAPDAAKPKSGKAGRSRAWKIANAMSAAPASVAKNATIVDYPASGGGEPPILRKGSIEWTCFPDSPETPANDPLCLDRMGMEWGKAWAEHRPPKLSASGLGYMLQGGGSASNTDPFAARPKEGDAWMKEPPHLMIYPVGKFDPDVYAKDEHSGKPWLMFAGTPWEHLMVPVR